MLTIGQVVAKSFSGRIVFFKTALHILITGQPCGVAVEQFPVLFKGATMFDFWFVLNFAFLHAVRGHTYVMSDADFVVVNFW